MSVLDILSEDFLAELPDDPRMAFAMVLRRAEAHVANALDMARSENDWAQCEAAQYTAMSTVIGVARRYKIEPFASMSVPPRSKFTSGEFDDFKGDLDHYVVQLVLDNSIRNKRDAVVIEPKVKDRLRQHISGIKTLIDQAAMSEPQRGALHRKIADFEAALEKPRVNVAMLAAALVVILSVTANVTSIADSQAMAKLVSNIMVTLGQAKAVDEAKRELPPAQPPQPLLPPREQTAVADFGGYALRPRETFSAELDDEIPF